MQTLTENGIEDDIKPQRFGTENITLAPTRNHPKQQNIFIPPEPIKKNSLQKWVIISLIAVIGLIGIVWFNLTFADKVFASSNPINVEGDTIQNNYTMQTYSNPTITNEHTIENKINLNMSIPDTLLKKIINESIRDNLKQGFNQTKIINEVIKEVTKNLTNNN